MSALAAQALEWSPRSRLLEELEERIENSRTAMLGAAEALAEIQEQKLYREAGFKTFDRYCRERWGFSHSRAYQLTDWARLRKEIPVENENQARLLAPAWRRNRAGVAEAFEALLGQTTRKEAVRELTRRARPVNNARSRGNEVTAPSEVFVIVALPVGQQASAIKVCATEDLAVSTRRDLEAEGSYRKVLMQVCEVES